MFAPTPLYSDDPLRLNCYYPNSNTIAFFVEHSSYHISKVLAERFCYQLIRLFYETLNIHGFNSLFFFSERR